MAKKKEEKAIEKADKMEKLLQMLEDEKKLAEKNDEYLSIGMLDDFKEIKRENYRFSSILGVDLNICGFKKGTFNVIYGDNSSGKTTIALSAIEGIQMQEPEAIILYVDTEGTVTDDYLARFPFLNRERILFLKEAVAEKCVDKMIEYVEANVIDYIIMDSSDTLISKKELEKDMDQAVIAEKARVFSRGLAKINPYMYKNLLTMIIIQQERIQFKGQFAVNGRSGGNALKFYPSTVLKTAPDTSMDITNSIGDIVIRGVKIKNEKSKVSQPYRKTVSYINVDSSIQMSIDRFRELIDYGINYGLIERKGAWYYLTDLSTGEVISANGANNLLSLLREKIDLYTMLKMHIYSKGLQPEMFIIKFDGLKTMLEKENELMKEKKIRLYKATGHEDKLNEMDKTKFEFSEDINPQTLLSADDYSKGNFILMSREEQDVYLEAKEKENLISEIKLVEGDDE